MNPSTIFRHWPARGQPLWLAVALLVSACATPADTTKKPEPADREPVVSQAIGAERAEFYRRAFAQAGAFRQHNIPKEMLRSVDQGNDTYIEAVDAQGTVLGYLRDFRGPVTIGEECPCAPLQVTLVLNPDFTLKTLIAPVPLTKKLHQPLSPEQMIELIDIVGAPHATVQKVSRIESIIDVKTGATKSEFAGHVLKDAGLSTMRLVGLVRDTARILQHAPMARDQERLNQLVSAANNEPSAVALALAEFRGDSAEANVFAYRTMVRAYIDALAGGKPPIPAVEARLSTPAVDPEVDVFELASSCYRLVTKNLASAWVKTCMEQLKTSVVNDATLKRISGTAAFWRKEWQTAADHLAVAVHTFSIADDADLHLRYAQSLQQGGELAQACATGKNLFRTHPLLPGVTTVLQTCAVQGGAVTTNTVITGLRDERRKALLGSDRQGSPAPEKLSLEDEKMKPIELVLAAEDKVTVALFFATWCPHCRVEFPRVVDFANTINKSILFKDRVRVIGVRTAVERETEPYEAFVKRFRPNFPIYTDATMALNFSRFSRSQGLTGGLPTLAVIDRAGDVRYILSTGDHSDTRRELEWAVGALLNAPKKARAKKSSPVP